MAKRNDNDDEFEVVVQKRPCGICYLEIPEDDTNLFATDVIARLVDTTQCFATFADQSFWFYWRGSTVQRQSNSAVSAL